MKAVEYQRYGAPEVLELVDVEKPGMKENEVLIKIHATSVTATECTFRKGKPYMSRLFTGLRKPKLKRLGEELAGEVEAVGSKVMKFKVGDRVFGTAGPGFGANAEYVCVPEDGVLCHQPEHLSFAESASSVDGFLTAMPFLRDTGRIKAGQKVLIIGASGSVGAAAVQIAKYMGTQVTGVCSTSNVTLVQSLGADEVVDYTKTDFTEPDNTYDIIFDAVGKSSYVKCKGSLAKNGVFLEAGIGPGILPHVLWTSLFGTKKARIAATGLRKPGERLKDLRLLRELLEKRIIQPVIDRSYPLADVAKAHAYVDTGRKKGNVVINVIAN